GWRPMCENERLAMFWFWRAVGERMSIHDVPADFAGFEHFNRDYERTHFRFAETSQRVGDATPDMFVGWFPKPFAPLVRSSSYALLDDSLIEAFGFPKPSRLMRCLVPNVLRVRARLVRWLPAGRRPRLRTEMTRAVYPNGYVIEELGPNAAG